MKIDVPVEDSIELAQNSAFIEWIRDGAKKNQWWDSLSQEEMEIVTEARVLVDVVSHENENYMDIGLHKNLWDRINTTIQRKEQRRKKHPLTNWIGLAVACAAVFTLIIMVMPNDTTNNVSFYAAAESSEVTLPEQSIITVSKGSTVSYDQSNWSEERVVNLEGEAFFDVTEGIPFTVFTTSGNITVLGTSFEVSESKAELAVSVSSGTVRVKTGQYQEVLLADDQYLLNLTADQLASLTLSKGKKYYKFIDHPVGQIMSVVEDLYHVDITLPASVSALEYSGYFDDSFPIEELISRITEAYRLTYDIKGSSITVYK